MRGEIIAFIVAVYINVLYAVFCVIGYLNRFPDHKEFHLADTVVFAKLKGSPEILHRAIDTDCHSKLHNYTIIFFSQIVIIVVFREEGCSANLLKSYPFKSTPIAIRRSDSFIWYVSNLQMNNFGLQQML